MLVILLNLAIKVVMFLKYFLFLRSIAIVLGSALLDLVVAYIFLVGDINRLVVLKCRVEW
jgi:hypothetical protein